VQKKSLHDEESLWEILLGKVEVTREEVLNNKVGLVDGKC